MATSKPIDFNKHIWEGWRVIDFINELQPTLDELYRRHVADPSNEYIGQPFKSKASLREWCKENQPYVKKRIPEVSNYFIQRYNIKK